jgi:tetratricopeptide (TPR) repeat protein
VLSADKGSAEEEAVIRDNPPYVSQHGSISVNVNYHAIAEWTKARSGWVLRLPHEHASIEVVGFAFGAEPLHARAAFAAVMSRFGPDDFYTLRKAIEPNFEQLTVEQALALVRLSDFDPRTFHGVLPVLTKAVPTASPLLQRDLFYTVESVGENYFHIGESKDFPFKLGLLLFQLKQYDRAAAWFEKSLAFYGPHPVTFYNLALCAHRQHDLATASARVDEALRLDPNHEGARSLRRTLDEVARSRLTEVVITIGRRDGAREELALQGDGTVRLAARPHDGVAATVAEARLPAGSVARLFDAVEAAGVHMLEPTVAAAGGNGDGELLAVEISLCGERRRIEFGDPTSAPPKVHELVGAVRLAASLAERS